MDRTNHIKLQVVGANSFPLQLAGYLVPSVLEGDRVFALGAYPFGTIDFRDFDIASQNNATIKFKEPFAELCLDIPSQAKEFQSTTELFQLGAYVVYWHRDSLGKIINPVPKDCQNLVSPECLGKFSFVLASTKSLKKWLPSCFARYREHLKEKLRAWMSSGNKQESEHLASHITALQSFAVSKEDALESLLLRTIFRQKSLESGTVVVSEWVKIIGRQWGIDYTTEEWAGLIAEKLSELYPSSFHKVSKNGETANNGIFRRIRKSNSPPNQKERGEIAFELLPKERPPQYKYIKIVRVSTEKDLVSMDFPDPKKRMTPRKKDSGYVTEFCANNYSLERARFHESMQNKQFSTKERNKHEKG